MLLRGVGVRTADGPRQPRQCGGPPTRGDLREACHHQVPGGHPGDDREEAAARPLLVSALCTTTSIPCHPLTTMDGDSDCDRTVGMTMGVTFSAQWLHEAAGERGSLC